MDEFEIWKRFAFFPIVPPPIQIARRLYVPAIEPVGGLPYELAGLLPNREHSMDLMALIEDLPANKFGDLSVVGVFAADPFLNCKRVADRLISKGYNQVTNIPPVAAYGSDFLATLDKVASGQAQEQHNIKQLVDRGLYVSPAIAAIDCLPAALSLLPHRLWVVPSFDMWRGEAINANQLLGLCSDITHLTEVPVVLIAGQTRISAMDASKVGARGILVDEGCDFH
jgi:hypothetical protein